MRLKIILVFVLTSFFLTNKNLAAKVQNNIVLKYENGYLLEDGVHRIAKLQKQGIFESLFYVVTIEEYQKGLVHMMFQGEPIPLGEWNHNALDPMKH